MNELLETLVKARAHLAEVGLHKKQYFGPDDTCCALGAIAWVRGARVVSYECVEFQLLSRTLDADLIDWNDDENTTLEDVLGLFDRCIAVLR